MSGEGRKVENGEAGAGDAIADVLATARAWWLEDQDYRALRSALLTLLVAFERDE